MVEIIRNLKKEKLCFAFLLLLSSHWSLVTATKVLGQGGLKLVASDCCDRN